METLKLRRFDKAKLQKYPLREKKNSNKDQNSAVLA
jgi:hypothetical protein